MSSLYWDSDSKFFFVKLEKDISEVHTIAKVCGYEKITDGFIKLSKKNIVNFYYEFIKFMTYVHPDAEKQIMELKEQLLTVWFTKKRVPIDLFLYKPYDIQYTGISRMCNTNAFGLFFEQGLGKTYIAIVTFTYHFRYNNATNCIIVCPPSVLYNWKIEFLKYSNDFTEDDILIINTNKEEHRDPFKLNKKIYIMTYDSFKIVCNEQSEAFVEYDKKKNKLDGKIEKLLKDGYAKDSEQVKMLREKKKDLGRFHYGGYKQVLEKVTSNGKYCLILDEAHKASSKKSKTTQTIMREAPCFEFRYLLSGTPIRKTPLELWALMRILSLGIIIQPYDDFENRLCKKGGFKNKQIEYYYRNEVKKLIDEDLSPYILRAFKKDHLDLPDLNISFLRYSLRDTSFEKSYLEFIDEITKDLEKQNLFINGKTIHYSDIKKHMLSVLRFIASPVEDNPRISIIKDYLETLIDEFGRDVVIWSYQPAVLDYLAEVFKKYNPVVVHGENPKSGKDQIKEREARKDKFINDPECKLALFSTLVMDTGITLLNTNDHIFFDIYMETIRHFQAEARSHRIGQKSDVNCYYLECIGEMDELACYILEKDRILNGSLFHNPDAFIFAKMKEVLRLRNTIDIIA